MTMHCRHDIPVVRYGRAERLLLISCQFLKLTEVALPLDPWIDRILVVQHHFAASSRSAS